MKNVVLCLGSNKGDRRFYIQEMIFHLKKVIRPPYLFSNLMETEPVDILGEQPWYLNQIVMGRFDGCPEELLIECQKIEKRLGREEKGIRSPRTADIDILLFGNEEISKEDLKIPHPALFSRRFCLQGTVEVLTKGMIKGFITEKIFDAYNNMSEQIKNQKIVLYS